MNRRLSTLLPFLALLVAAGPGHATPEAIYPGLIDVTGVAVDDVLNIRSQPDAGSEIIGTLAPDAMGIEVIETRDNWLRVNSDGQSGWISARYATMRQGIWAQDRLPESFACYGTEPFWSLTPDGDQMRFSTPETVTDHDAVKVLSPSDWMENPRRVVVADALTALITPAAGLCSDGMSGARFGLDIDLVVGAGSGAAYRQGCCTLAP